MDFSALDQPEEVTYDNWGEVQAQGFIWLTNLHWPLREEIKEGLEQTPRQFLEALNNEFDSENVMLGHPFIQESRSPNQSLRYPSGTGVGVYIRPPKGYYQI